MNRMRLGVVSVLMLLVGSSPAWAVLKAGDVAPPLTVTDWIKGKPFDLVKDGRGKVVVLEFWATWCAPCIQMIPETNAFYQKYKDKGLLMVAVTDAGQGQTLRLVQDFVSRQGNQMDYPVAFDRTEKTYASYVMGSGAYGIPYAAVIDKTGKIAWLGHPAQPEMRTIVVDLLLDRFDPKALAAKVAKQEQISPLLNDFNEAGMRGDWEKALAAADAILKIDAGHFDAMRFTVAIYLEEIRSPDRLRTWATKFIDAHADDAEALVTLAALMLAAPNPVDRQPDLALEAARRGLEAAGDDASIIQGVAQIRFQLADIDAAIEIQKQAVAKANSLEADSARKVMKFYETCKSLQKTPQ